MLGSWHEATLDQGPQAGTLANRLIVNSWNSLVRARQTRPPSWITGDNSVDSLV